MIWDFGVWIGGLVMIDKHYLGMIGMITKIEKVFVISMGFNTNWT